VEIQWTTVIASAVTAVVIGSAQFITTRYLSRILDRLEKDFRRNNRKDKDETDS
jgi:hypothetical protein